MRAHWREYGRNYYTRHDYENIEQSAAQKLFSELRNKVASLVGKCYGDFEVLLADDFKYTDPVDNSISERQGVRILFNSGARIIFRLSGTGTQGATLRVYFENYEENGDLHDVETQEYLAPLIQLANKIACIEKITGRLAPNVIT